MKLNTEQEIINLKTLIEEREEEAVRNYQLKLTRKYLYSSSIVTPLNSEEVQLYE